MCGIAGILSLRPDAPVKPEELRAMAARLGHRGPDDVGEYLDSQRRCGLAFRRLAIVDLETGNQPIANEDGSVQAIFNGEIYNYQALRDELRRAGHLFRTRGDAEAIVHAWEQYGDAFPQKLDGMFAIALWDARRAALALVRDRFGKKPLVYAAWGGRLYFASEAKALLALPHVRPALDAQSLHRYLLFGYVPAPHSIYQGFHKLPPAHMLMVSAATPAGAPGPEALPRGAQTHHALAASAAYWLPPRPRDRAASGEYRLDYETAKQQFAERLADAVQRRLMADVPLGAFLSGGVDSSVVVGLMKKLGVQPLKTFSIGFAGAPDYDETAFARRVAEHFGTEHHEQIVTPEARAALDVLAWHFDEPFADSSAIPTYYVSRYTREHVTVALTGDGGDECWGGYDRYRAVELGSALDALPGSMRRGLARLGARLPGGRFKSRGQRWRRFLTALRHDGARRYQAWVGLFSPESLAAGYRSEWLEQLAPDEPLAWFAGIYDCDGGDAPNRANCADLVSYLPDDLLTKVDLASMACSLECRCPFLDPAVIACVFDLPPAWRMGKKMLRQWAREFVPPAALNRPKMGFGVPVGQWLRGPLRDLLDADILSPDALASRMFCADWLARLCGEHLSGRADHGPQLWGLVMLERWRRTWT